MIRMIGLILETSTLASCLILSKDGIPLQTSFLEGGKGLALSLFQELPTFLKGIKLDYVASGIGPGSFTGIRIGAAIAQAISYAQGIPLLGFCSLSAFIPDQEGIFYSAISAKSFGLHFLQGTKTKETISFLEKPLFLSWDEAFITLQKDIHLISPDPALIQEKLGRCCKKEADPTWLSRFLHSKFLQGEYERKPFLDLIYGTALEPVTKISERI